MRETHHTLKHQENGFCPFALRIYFFFIYRIKSQNKQTHIKNVEIERNRKKKKNDFVLHEILNYFFLEFKRKELECSCFIDLYQMVQLIQNSP